MGQTKDEMKPTETKKGTGLGRLLGRRKSTSAEESADKFADMIERSQDRLGELLAIKRNDLDKEKGQEAANAKKVAYLEIMQYHLDSIVETASRYAEE